jgi:osmotically inducible protein OsmC
MPRITRNASVVWEGNVARGRGSISAASGAFESLPYSLPSRIAKPEGKTSPEELLAAAHGGCFAMSLAGELTGDGTPPQRVEVHCEILMDEVEGQGHQVIGSTVRARVAVEGVDDDAFAEVVKRADEGCAFSALLKRSGADVAVDAELAR